MNAIRARRPTRRRRAAPEEEWDWWLTYANPLLMLRCGGICERCGTPLGTTHIERHHRIRRRDGGDRLSNLMALCRTCHIRVTDYPTEAYANGWSIRALDEVDPETIPVRLAPTGHMWLLLDNGTKKLLL